MKNNVQILNVRMKKINSYSNVEAHPHICTFAHHFSAWQTSLMVSLTGLNSIPMAASIFEVS